jgi:hypothetical protein
MNSPSPRLLLLCLLPWTSFACASEPAASAAQAAAQAVTLRSDIAPITDAAEAKPGVFIPPYVTCQTPHSGDTGDGPDGQVCTRVAISGCTEPGKYFPDYASCAVVRTQRPFWPEAPAHEPSPDDPRLQDDAFMRELAWMTQQVEASGCSCCHDARQNDGMTGQWDIRHGPIWLDTLSDSGLSLFIGLADSSTLGAYPAADNAGFDRSHTGLPTTDTDRMQAFLRRELDRRGITQAQAAAVPPFGGPIYENRLKRPTPCSAAGHGIDPDLHVQYRGGPARYVYVLADGSDNPGVPPNLDLPEGTLWRLDVLANADALTSGFRYGTTPPGSFQAMPERGKAPALKRGETYQLYVLRDVGLPIANCSFRFGDALLPTAADDATRDASTSAWDGGAGYDAGGACTLAGGDAEGFGAACTTAPDCSCKANYCALMPGQTQGICTLQGCKEDASLCPSDYSCLDLSVFGASLPSICTHV